MLRARIDPHRRRCGAREILGGARGFRRPLEGSQLNLLPERVPGCELRRRQIDLRGIQDRPVPVVAQLFVTVDDSVPQALHGGGRIIHVHQHAVRRQVFEKMRGTLEEQRQKIFDATGRHARADVAVDRLLGQIAGKTRAIAPAELAHRVGIERCFARRQQLYAIQLVHRPLRVRIEAADAVDVAIEHVDSIRHVRTHREHVDQGSAHRKFAMGDDLRDGGISSERQLGAQCVEIQPLAHVNLE